MTVPVYDQYLTKMVHADIGVDRVHLAPGVEWTQLSPGQPGDVMIQGIGASPRRIKAFLFGALNDA